MEYGATTLVVCMCIDIDRCRRIYIYLDGVQQDAAYAYAIREYTLHDYDDYAADDDWCTRCGSTLHIARAAELHTVIFLVLTSHIRFLVDNRTLSSL